MGVMSVDGSVGPSFSDVERVTRVGYQLRFPPYGTFQNEVVGGLNWRFWRQIWPHC